MSRKGFNNSEVFTFMHTAMVFSPHADDAAVFCGGTLAKLSAGGWKVVLVRVTDDARDSVGLTMEETVRRNTEELHEAAALLGIGDIVELGFPTDTLADVPETVLRERFVYLLRKYRPYTVFTFDPFGHYEGNLDHIRVAQAVEEAFWLSCFDLHHPEHFKEGLEPFSVYERWYFGRPVTDPNHVEDITDYFQQRVAALAAHRTMMRNTINQTRLQLRTGGRRAPLLDGAMTGDCTELLAGVMQAQAAAAAEAGNLGADRLGESFRKTRFGDLDDFFDEISEPLPDIS
jgi:N-acetylglucosamine malate deacetylase 1